MTDRRSFIRQAGTMTAAASMFPFFNILGTADVEAAVSNIEHLSPLDAALDEDFWFTIRQAYTVSSNIINLNNGGVSPQPVVTQDALTRNRN